MTNVRARRATRDWRSAGRFVVVGVLLAVSACRRPAQSGLTALPPTLGDLAARYIALVVELGERDVDSLDDAVVPSGYDRFRQHPEPLAAIHDHAVALVADLDRLDDAAGPHERGGALLAQAATLVLRTEQLAGSNRPFDDESRIFFQVLAPADHDQAARVRVRAQIGRMLNASPSSDLAQRYAELDAPFVVPPARVPAVMELALAQCRALTVLHMPLPAGEHVEVRYVFRKPWSAFSTYLGHAQSRIEVNMDYPLTVDRLLDLACHEGYPGHHIFNSVRDVAVVQRMQLPEFEVQPTFSPQSFVSEAAASYAPELLPAAERLHIERDLLCPAAALPCRDIARYLAVQRLVAALHTAEPAIAREYLDGRLEFVRAADALERELLMQHGEVTLLYLNEYRTYMLTYTLGRDMVRGFVEQGARDEDTRWQRYRSLMEHPWIRLPGAPAERPPA